MKILKIVYLYLKKSIQKKINFWKAKKIKKSIKSRMTTSELCGKILILIPHADDEWVGCSTLVRNQKLDIILCNMDMQGGDCEDKHKLRYDELVRCAKEYKRKLINIKGNEKEKKEKLREIIKKEKPNYIATPFYIDWHLEHNKVNKMLEEVLKEKININLSIIMYQVSVPILEHNITNSYRLTPKEQKEKWDIFKKIYKSQKTLPIERFKCNEYINGVFFNEYAAEVFSIVSDDEWLKKERNLSEIDRKKIEENYKDIYKIRKIIRNIG